MRRALVAVLALTLGVACAAPEPRPAEWTPLDPADPDEVDSVVFLVGDAGNAFPGRSPILAGLRDEVERWSALIGRDSAVSVFYLGDVVYPLGVRERDHPDFRTDSLHVAAQVDVVSGPVASRLGTRGVFLAGNHDWGQRAGDKGLARLQNLDVLLGRIAEEEGVAVDLLPAAGAAGPSIIDMGERVRVLVLDTHWWLQARDDPRLDRVAGDVAEAIRTAGDREIVATAHHPFISGGAHGGPIPVWRGLGLLWLMRKSGSLVQDLNSVPFREFRLELRAAFAATRPPLVWAGGHDHSLQVIAAQHPDQPSWNLISGSASKLTGVTRVPGMVYGGRRPGYMRLTFLRDGGVILRVFGAAENALHCNGPPSTVEACIQRGVASFRTFYADRLR